MKNKKLPILVSNHTTPPSVSNKPFITKQLLLLFPAICLRQNRNLFDSPQSV